MLVVCACLYLLSSGHSKNSLDIILFSSSTEGGAVCTSIKTSLKACSLSFGPILHVFQVHEPQGMVVWYYVGNIFTS